MPADLHAVTGIPQMIGVMNHPACQPQYFSLQGLKTGHILGSEYVHALTPTG